MHFSGHLLTIKDCVALNYFSFYVINGRRRTNIIHYQEWASVLLEQTKNINYKTYKKRHHSIVNVGFCLNVPQLFILVHYTQIWRFKRPTCFHFFMHPILTLLNEQSLLIRLLKHTGRSLTFPVARSNTFIYLAMKQYDPY